MKLYTHQSQAVDFLAQRGFTGAIFADAGTGKTLMALEAFQRLRGSPRTALGATSGNSRGIGANKGSSGISKASGMLGTPLGAEGGNPGLKMVVCAPLSLLEAAWGADIRQFTNFTYYNAHDKPLPSILREDILLINYDVVITKRASHLLSLVQGNLLVADECFDGNTLIDTPFGKEKIKNLTYGCLITNCNGIDKVIGTRIKKLDRWIKIRYNNKWVKCSYNHPFLTQKGWISAHNLKRGDNLVKTNYAMSMVQKRIAREDIQQIRKKNGNQQESFLQHILFSEMENEATRNQRKNLLRKSKQEKIYCDKEIYGLSFRGRKNKKGQKKQQIIFTGSKSQNISKIKINTMETNNSGREWKASPDSTKQIIKTSGKIMDCGISSSYETKKPISFKLQNRHCLSSIKNRDRSRRIFSQQQKKTRSEKRQFINFFRVEDIKIYQQRSNRKSQGNIKENLFYDLQIEKHPSFSINGVLVHNSSRMKNSQAKTTKAMLLLGKLAKYRIVMTATPAPNTPMEYWGQLEFLHPRLLHSSGSFYAFRNSYFHLQRGTQVFHGQHITKVALMDAFRTGFKYEITPANLKKLMAKIEPIAYRIKKEDCLDLPDQVDEVRFVYLTAKTLKHYREMKNDLITEIKHSTITAEMALTKIMKLRELSSSFIMDSSGKAIGIGRECDRACFSFINCCSDPFLVPFHCILKDV